MAEAESAGETFAIEGRASSAAAGASTAAEASRDDDRHAHADDKEARMAAIKQQQFVLPVKARLEPWFQHSRPHFPLVML